MTFIFVARRGKKCLKIIETFRMAMLPDTYSDKSILGGDDVISLETSI